MSKVQDIFGAAPKSVLNKPLIHVQHQAPQGTDGPSAAVGYNTIGLNTLLTNEIPGSNFQSNAITLPAGEYYCEGWGSGDAGGSHAYQLSIQADGNEILRGGSFKGSASSNPEHLGINGRFTLTQGVNITLHIQSITSVPLGRAANLGTEVYADLRIWKLDSDIETPVISDPTLTLARPLLHVREEQPDGSVPPAVASNAWTTRVINSIVFNSIPGATLGVNEVTLPAGTYECNIKAEAGSGVRNHRARLVTSTGDLILVGMNAGINGGVHDVTNAIVQGRFTLTATTTLRIDHFTNQAAGAFGVTSSDTDYPEYWLEAMFWQLDAVVKQPVLVNDKLYPLPGNVMVTGNMHGLEYEYTSANTITVNPGICMDSTNEFVLQLSGSQVVSIPAVGTTVYNLFLTDDAETVKVDTDVDGANLPAQDKRRWIGFVRTNSSGDICLFTMNGDAISWGKASENWLPAFGSTNYETSDHTGLLPIARIALIAYTAQRSAGSGNTNVPASLDGVHSEGYIGRTDGAATPDTSDSAWGTGTSTTQGLMPFKADRYFKAGANIKVLVKQVTLKR